MQLPLPHAAHILNRTWGVRAFSEFFHEVVPSGGESASLMVNPAGTGSLKDARLKRSVSGAFLQKKFPG